MLRTRMPKVDLPLDQRNIIITRSKEGILDIKKIFISKGANVFDLMLHQEDSNHRDQQYLLQVIQKH